MRESRTFAQNSVDSLDLSADCNARDGVHIHNIRQNKQCGIYQDCEKIANGIFAVRRSVPLHWSCCCVAGSSSFLTLATGLSGSPGVALADVANRSKAAPAINCNPSFSESIDAGDAGPVSGVSSRVPRDDRRDKRGGHPVRRILSGSFTASLVTDLRRTAPEIEIKVCRWRRRDRWPRRLIGPSQAIPIAQRRMCPKMRHYAIVLWERNSTGNHQPQIKHKRHVRKVSQT